MVEPFLLTLRLVAEKALPLLIAGKLQRCMHKPDFHGCRYRHPVDGSPCVVGAALPDEIASAGDNHPTYGRLGVMGLRDQKLISLPSHDDAAALNDWQRMHDEGRLAELREALEATLTKPEGAAS